MVCWDWQKLAGAEELFVRKAQYEVFEALNPFFKVVMEGLRGLMVLHRPIESTALIRTYTSQTRKSGNAGDSF
jgi:hypothetical protein